MGKPHSIPFQIYWLALGPHSFEWGFWGVRKNCALERNDREGIFQIIPHKDARSGLFTPL